MTRTLQAIALALAVVAGSHPSKAGEPKTMTPAERQVRAAVEAMTAAFHAKDIDRVMQAYEAQSNIVFQPDKPVEDRQQIVAKFRELFAVSPRFADSGHQVFVSGDLAVHIAPWTMTGTAPNGEKLTDTGLSVAVLRRQGDGEWRIVIDNPYGGHLLGTN